MSNAIPRCTLDASGQADARARYTSVADRYTATVAFTDDEAWVELRGQKPELRALLDEMIAREAGCCAHIHFAFTETAGGFAGTLHVSGAPGQERSVLKATMPALFPNAAVVQRA